MKKHPRKKQPSGKTASSPKRRARIPRLPRPIRFPEVVGKTVEWVELYLDDEFNSIELSFADKTALRFDLQSALFVRPDLANWKTGNRRDIKEWRMFRSPLMRE